MFCISFFSVKVAIMSSKGPSTHFYERGKKSQNDVDASEGGSSNPPPQRATKRIVHRDFLRARMSIDTEIEEEEENPMETSDDESIDDETYGCRRYHPLKIVSKMTLRNQVVSTLV
jgi:hypothetical protein